MKAVISGYYGHNNTGDEAVLDVILSGLRKINPSLSVTVLSAGPKGTSSAYSVNSVHKFSVISVLKEIRSCDIFISGGGTLLQDSTGPFTVMYYLSLVWMAKFFGKKAVFFGQGYGPVKSAVNKRVIKAVLNNVDLITLRDENSMSQLKALGVNSPEMVLCADPAFLLDKAPISELIRIEGLKELGNRGIIGVCPRALIGDSASSHTALAASLDEISERLDVEILFIPFQFPNDVEECTGIASLMKSNPNIITHEHHPKELMGLIDSLDAVIGTRLHSLIFAAACGVPCLGIDYDPKVTSLMESLSLPHISPNLLQNDLVSAVEALWNNRDQVKETSKKRVEIIKLKAGLNFASIAPLIDPTANIRLFGARIHNVSMLDSLAAVERFLQSGKPNLIITPNPEIIMAAQKDKELLDIINNADLDVPDGIGILAASKILRTPLPERVTGIDLMIKILDLAKEKGYKVFLLGSAPGVAEQAAANLKGVNVVGTHDGYFKDAEDRQIVDQVKNAKPDILFVGMGAPRQEKWLAKYYKEMGAKVNMAVGGSMDVISGKVSRAPEITQKLGIEWLWRLTKEPKRWRRQLNLIAFMGKVIKQKYLPF